MQPTITICTDASYRKYHKYGYGSWACYIRTPYDTVKTGAVLKQSVDGSTEAERYGIANALAILDKMIDISEYRIILYCDNESSLKTTGYVRNTPKSRYYEKQLATQEWYDEYVNKYLHKAKSYDLRHVKGHTSRSEWSTTSKRNYMNNWVDVHARNLLRHAIEKKKGELRKEARMKRYKA